MIIRLAREIDDIQACVAVDHSFVTNQVWQMDSREQPNGMSVVFRRVRLPRDMHGRYPRHVEGLVARWEGGDTILVAEGEGQIVGYIHLVIQASENSVWVRNLAVVPHLRRRGIGTALLHAAAEWLRRQKADRLMLETTTKNYPAICFAQKLGFSFCGYNDRYYENQDIALFFAKSLR